MTKQMTRQEMTKVVRLRMDLAAEAMRQMPTTLRGGWVVYLLEALDPGSRGTQEERDDFRAMLDRIARSIAIRLESREW